MSELQEITERVRAAVAEGGGLDKSMKLDLGDDGKILIDGTSVSNDDGKADLIVTTSVETLRALRDGTMEPRSALMSGKLKVSNMLTAMGMQAQIGMLFRKMAS
jgi:putative sterol carrier protein